MVKEGQRREGRPGDTLVVILGAFTVSAAGVLVVFAGLRETSLGQTLQDLLCISAALSLAIGQPAIVEAVARRGGWRPSQGMGVAMGVWCSALVLLAGTVVLVRS